MTASQKGTANMDAVNVWKIFEDLGLKGKKRLSFEDFLSIFMDHSQDLSKMGLDFKGIITMISVIPQTSTDTHEGMYIVGVRQTFLVPESKAESVPGGVEDESLKDAGGWSAALRRKRLHFLTLLEENKQQVFYLGLFFVVVIGVWLERFSCTLTKPNIFVFDVDRCFELKRNARKKSHILIFP